MKKEDILDAIGRIDRDLIEETDSLRQKTGKKAVWLRWAAGAAACVALTAALWIGLIRPRQNENREERGRKARRRFLWSRHPLILGNGCSC